MPLQFNYDIRMHPDTGVRNSGLQQLGASVDMALGCMLCVQVGVLVTGRSKNMHAVGL
jgi:hypothetical protein